MKTKWAILVALVGALALIGATAAFATQGNFGPGPHYLVWDGQGSAPDPADCQGDTPNPGDMLFILTTDGATDPTVQGVTGVTSGSLDSITQHGNSFHILITGVTDLEALIGSLRVDFTYADDSKARAETIFTLSHGCPGDEPGPFLPTVSKDASGSYDDTFEWTIEKSADPTSVQLGGINGGTTTVDYTVTVSHGDSQISNVKVTGTITVNNLNLDDVTLDSITDQLSDGTDCVVDTPDPIIASSGETKFGYECDLGDALPQDPLTNTVTITWLEQTVGSGTLPEGDASYTTDPIEFVATEIDTCVDVEDTIAGDLGTVCVGDDNPYTFTYSEEFDNPPLGYCQTHDNTASFTTNDTGATGDDSASVEICNYKSSLTIGYWKTHMHQCVGKEKQATGGCSNNGPFTAQYLGNKICSGPTCTTVGTLGNYQANTDPLALAVFNANNCSSASTSNSNAAACLAAQLLGAELNVANGGNACICSVIKDANALLAAIGYNGPGSTVNFSGTNTRAYALALKDKLDYYNNNSNCNFPT